MSLFVFTLWNEVRKSIIIAVSQRVGQLAEKNGRCRRAGWARTVLHQMKMRGMFGICVGCCNGAK